MNTTTTRTTTPLSPTSDIRPAGAAAMTRGHIGRIVTLTMLGGLLGAVAAVVGPFAGAEEHVITGTVLAAFACSWALLAALTTRWTDQPQRWAAVPAATMAIAATAILIAAPTGNELGWVWPPAILSLVAWMAIRSRRDLHSRARAFVLYPVFAALAVSALGGAYQTFREHADKTTLAMTGRLVSVGDHRLHIDCTGSGSPTVVLEPGMGESSAAMSGWIAPTVAAATRVCVYDRAGRGWSEAASHPLDGTETAADLHTLLRRAGEAGPYILAGHSAGGIYVMNFARLYPQDVAGLVLLDSMHPEQYARIPAWPGFYAMFRRASALFPSLSRLGGGRLINASSYGDLPARARTEERAFQSTPRDLRSTRDEFSEIRIAMSQANTLITLGDRPLIVVTAQRDAEGGWAAAQNDLLKLSANSVHRLVPTANHSMLTENRDGAAQSSRAVNDIVEAVRAHTPLTAEDR